MGYKLKRILIYPDGVTEKQVYPAGWKPGANTIAYYPLNSTTTVNDMSGNNRNLTNGGGITFGTNGGIDCASFGSSNAIGLTVSSTGLTGNPTFTFNVCINRKGYTSTVPKSQIFMVGPINSNYADIGVAINGINGANNEYQFWGWGNPDIDTGAYNTADSWELITFTSDGTTQALYINGSKVKEGNLTLNITGGNLTIGSFPTVLGGTWQRFYGYMSEFIIESNKRSQDMITGYLNQIKDKYGIS